MTAAAAIAGRTKNIRIGQGVVLLPFYGHPLKLAEDAAVLDVISGGRFELGIGRGYRPHEFAGFGLNQKQRRSMTDEGIEIIRRAWSGERFSFSGKHYQVNDVRLTPTPVQKPPRLWLGAGTPSSRRRVTDPYDAYFESDNFRRDRHIIGDPEFCAGELRRYRDEANIEIMILRMQFPGQPTAQVMRSLELLAREVIPRVGN